MASQAFLEKAYLAYFGRPVDPVGLFAFKDSTEAQVYTAFFESAESRSLYGDGFGVTQINAVYQMLFGRDAEPAGITYWANQITLGLLTPASAALGILNGAKNTDAVAVANKLAASHTYTASLDTLVESSAYVGDGAAAFARDFLKSVSTFPATQSQVDVAIKGLVNLGGTSFIGTDHVFTLQESVVAGQKAIAGTTVVYWGYNPHPHGESGVDNTVAGTTGASNTNNLQGSTTTNFTNEGPADGGIPVADLVSFLTNITGLDLKELGLIDANGVDPFQNVTNLSLSNPLTATGGSSTTPTNGTTTSSGSGAATGTAGANASNMLTISFADGTSLNAEVKLGDAYFKFLHDLLFDAQGNSRLYEKTTGAVNSTADKLQPIRLTPYENNGGTIETGTVTTSGNDLIVAGRLELLHQAYIDGGAGTNILEIDAKGTYAQPASLKNIQEIRVNDLPNWYTTGTGFVAAGTSITNAAAGGNLNNTAFNGFLSPTGTGSDDSWLDLSRAVDIKKLVVTDGSNDIAATGSGSNDYDYSGNLTIVGVRNGAMLRLEGGFKSGNTTIQYGQGQTGTLNVELAVGDVTANINILQNAAVLNIDSTGVVNHLHNFFGGGSVSRLVVKGTGEFAVDENISSSFNQNAAVLIDASANTGGLNINFDASGGSDVNGAPNVASRFASVTVKGTTVDDVVMVQNVKAYTPDQIAAVNGATTSTNILNGKVTIDVGNGDNSVVTDGSDIVKVTTGTGDDTIMAKNGQVVTIVAGDGANVVNADSTALDLAVVTITTGAGTDNISAMNGKVVTIVAGDGNNLITADGSETVTVTTGTGNDKISAVGTTVKTVVIDAGAGNNTITATGTTSINITTSTGNDKITAVGPDITINSGGGTDAIVLSGTYSADGVTAANGSMLNINTGATGSATITFGNDQSSATPAWSQLLNGVTALDGSVISGNNVKLYIDSATNLTQADLTGLLGTTKVVVENGDILRITSDQFKALGAAAFSAFLSGAGAQTGDVYILLKAGTSFDLASVADLASLSSNVKLHFELQEASNLTLTAEQLHKYLANDAITSVSGTNGALSTSPNGVVTLKAVGNAFDWTSDVDLDRVFGTITEANVDNLIVTRDSAGYNRPTDVVTTDVYTIDSVGTDPLAVGSVTTEAMTFKLTGTQAINFTGVVDLGGDVAATVPGDDILAGQLVAGGAVTGTLETDAFVVDFSTLTAKVTGLTLNHFQDVKSIKGNGIAGTRIDVILNADVGTAGVGKGLVTSGVDTYMVTRVDLNQDGAPDGSGTVWFNLCDASQDVKNVGLKGNAGSTLVIKDVPWGKVAPHIVLEGDGYANANEALKVDLSPNFSDVGSVTAEYNSGGAFAVVDINNGGVELGTTATGAERKFKVGTVTLTGATSATVNVAQGDATIAAIAGSTLSSVKFVATEDVTVTAQLSTTLNTIDASGVVGAFTATMTDSGTHKFAVTGGTGGLNLTLNGVDVEPTTGLDDNGSSINGGAAGANLTISATSNLANAVLTNINKVTLETGTQVTLTMAQVAAIAVSDIVVDKVGSTGTLNLVGLDNTPFSVATLTTGMSIGTVTLASNPVVTLDPTTNLTGVTSLAVPDGTTLNLTAAQFQQLGDGTGIRSITGTGTPGSMGTVNITGLKQSDITKLDLNGDGDYTDAGEHAGFDLSVITGVKFGTITLAESVTLKDTDSFGSFTKITMGDGLTLALGEINQANGLKITGGANTVLQILDTNLTGTTGNKIDAAGLNVTTIKLLNVLVAGQNVDAVLDHLPGAVVKEIYNDNGWVNMINQIVTVTAGTTVSGALAFNPLTNDTELQNFTLNLSGGTEISGSLSLASTTKIVNATQQMRTHLDTLTINSTGTAANLLNGKTVNTITGDITPLANPAVLDTNTPSVVGASQNNNLLNVVINASQALAVNGDVVFSSVVGDDTYTGNDNASAVAKLTVNGTSSVTLGTVNTTDDDVDSLMVVNNSTGTLTLTLDAAKLDQLAAAPAGNDALSFTGTGAIALKITGGVILSDDTLTSVSKITINDNSTLTLTQAQFNTLTAANIVTDGTPVTVALNLVEFGNAPFNASAIATGISTTITLAAGVTTLDPTTNLTGVTAINIYEGSTLNLTAAQFQQLKGTGSIVGLDGADTGTTVQSYTVNITDLKQTDVTRDSDTTPDGDTLDAIDTFNLSGIVSSGDAPKITIKLADASVQMGTLNAATNAVLSSAVLNGAEFILADNQTLALVTSTQANGLKVTGGVNSTLTLRFAAMDAADTTTGINAAGFNVTSLRALDQFVDGTNVEFRMLNVPGSVVEYYFNDPTAVGLIKLNNRVVVVEKGVTVPGYLMYNDPQTTQEVRSLDLTMSGGSEISGDLNLSTIAKTLTAQNFDTLTIHSAGAATDKNLLTAAASNLITGNIHARGDDVVTGNTGLVTEIENNLLKVVIDATTQALTVGGDIVFSKIGATADGAATLTLTGAANVQVQQLDVSDAQVTSLTIANNGTGTLTVTGASPAIFDGLDTGSYTDNTIVSGVMTHSDANLKTLTFSGTGNVVLGTHPDTTVTTEWGISASNLSVITAAGMSGNLDLGEIKDVSTAGFTFTSGTGTTKLTLTSDLLDAVATKSAVWTFDMTNAGANSELHIGAMAANAFGNAADLASTTTSNTLNIKLGANTTLYIDANTDFTQLDGFTLSQVKNIVLKDGVTLTLTAAQANTLKIVAGADDTTNGVGISAATKVNVTMLGDTAVDLSGVATNIAGDVTLEDDDVSLAVATNLGSFTVALNDVNNNGSIIGGQTIRFATVAQAERAVRVGAEFFGTDSIPATVIPLAANDNDIDTVSSTNVVWMFNTMTTPIDTSKYDAELGRLIYSAALVNSFGGLVENMFTTLPSSILRVDFATVTALNILLNSSTVNRTMEFSNFVTVGNLTYSDIGLTPVEHLQSLNMVLGGQVTVGNVLIDDMIPAAGYNPIGANQFAALTIDSQLALTGRTAASIVATALPPVTNPFPNNLASEAYVNNNNGINTTGETAQPNNINTVGNIGVGALNGLDLLTVNLKTNAVSVVGNQTAGTGAALSVGTITFGTTTAASTATLNLSGANNITATSVSTVDTDITALVINTAPATLPAFTGVTNIPGASPALQLNNTQSVTFTNGGVLTGTAITVVNDAVDDGTETMTVNYVLNGVAGSVTVPAATDFTNATTVAAAIAGLLDAVVGITSTNLLGVVNTAAEVGSTLTLTSVTVAGNAQALAGTFTNGGTINLGSAGTPNAGIAGNELSIIDGRLFGGTLNLGILAQLDSSNDTADLNNSGDMTGPGEVRALTFNSGTGLTTATLATANGLTPVLNAGSEWLFDYTNADAGSYLKITPTVTLTAGSTLRLNSVPLVIEGAVSLTQLVDNVTTVAPTVEGLYLTGTTKIEVLAGATLTLTYAQVKAFNAVDIFGAGTLKIIGDATEPASAYQLGANIKTAIVDVSALTILLAPAVGFDLSIAVDMTSLAGATVGGVTNVAQTIVGATAFANVITTTGTGNDVITGGTLNDQLTGGSGNDTFNVTGGTDTIVGLTGDGVGAAVAGDDVLVVAVGATANASLTAGFIATAATVNNGTVVLTDADAAASSTVDMRLAGGTKGFTITGGVTGNDIILGSANADIINGGNTNQTVATNVDTLTGGGGADSFLFNVTTSTPLLMTRAASVVGIDQEKIVVTADGADGGAETITIGYALNGVAGIPLFISDPGLVTTDISAVAAAIAAALNGVAGITATANTVAGEVLAVGDDGGSLTVNFITPTNWTVGALTVTGTGTDVAQKDTLTVTNGAALAGEVFSALVVTKEGINIGVNYVAGAGDSQTVIAAGLVLAFNNAPSNAGKVLAGNVAGVITFTDQVVDDGGFTLTSTSQGTFNGSGASNIGALTLATADVITDFVSGTDNIKLTGMAAAVVGVNYLEHAVEADYTTALASANTAFNGSILYYVSSTAADGGLMFFDANHDGLVDGVIKLTGITDANFAAGDILAGA